jgi:hypothetical protein
MIIFWAFGTFAVLCLTAFVVGLCWPRKPR